VEDFEHKGLGDQLHGSSADLHSRTEKCSTCSCLSSSVPLRLLPLDALLEAGNRAGTHSPTKLHLVPSTVPRSAQMGHASLILRKVPCRIGWPCFKEKLHWRPAQSSSVWGIKMRKEEILHMPRTVLCAILAFFNSLSWQPKVLEFSSLFPDEATEVQ
jgi:hypothetical protein